MLEVFRQTGRIKHGEIWLRRRAHVLQRVEEAVAVLGHHVTAVLSDAAYLKGSPNGVAAEYLIIRRYACELHHAEL